MSQDYNYDEQGQFFPYFVLTIVGLITLPTTYSAFRKGQDLENTATRIKSDFQPEHADLIEGQRKKQRRRERKLKRMVVAAAGWALMAGMVYLIIVTARTVPKIWDPYDVLGASRSWDERKIKSHYRKLSLTHHPDKRQPDPAKNETVDLINDEWVEMTKAFKTLTDEEVRNNYIQYGHPDGKQSFSIGIALPKFIISEGNGKYVLMLYGALLGVILPYFVGKWWYGSQKVTKEKILVASAGNLFREYENEMTEGDLINAISSGEEFKHILHGKSDAGLARIEQRILADGEASPLAGGLGVKDRAKLQELDEGVRRKALGLLWAYLGRVELDDQALNDEKYEVAPTALALTDAFTSMSLAYGNTKPLLAAYHTSQNLIQAVPPRASPLLQLPRFTPAVVRAVEGETARTHLTVQDFMRIPADQRKKRAVGPGLLTEKEYNAAIQIASQLPALKVEKAFFKVVGERFVTPSSLVQFVVKARIIPPGANHIPEVNEKDLEDVDAKEGDLDALHGRKKNDPEDAENRIQPPLAHAPFFARDHSPRWHVFLADSKQGKIAVPPFTFSTFDKPLFDERGNPTFNVQTLKMQFGAPPHAGRYTFVMHLICDSYIGMDTKMEVTLVVEEASKAEEMVEEEEISEPEEGTVMGQMNALKKDASAKQRPRRVADESSGSDTEGDEETESETDTDTDTDDE
ncbi:hypothetical protein W97_01457 [Coniosporium apollinis CBS 100218]|uniref:J domain-containing protein n=1 Tax=Coniosporium apollinis (strain CBS 100218) TaxID=1168221 RepID=R7YKT1_CONA1|nr:uncharacterized protein W97_01457 [Coniosporium apollinis CBS 100218]EON62236.1 hypothetical protein W97_01457 [Coniosporium apollinis CBS 100218]